MCVFVGCILQRKYAFEIRKQVMLSIFCFIYFINQFMIGWVGEWVTGTAINIVLPITLDFSIFLMLFLFGRN